MVHEMVNPKEFFTGQKITDLHTANWLFAHATANSFIDAQTALAHIPQWFNAVVPGTVAQSLRLAGQEKNPQFSDIDQFDWWYHCEFNCEQDSAASYTLAFDGLATLADVWLNGQLICHTQNMFVPALISVSDNVRSLNQLVICFRSNAAFLNQKRPRPQWKTHLVNHQQLRWLRTTLIGRIPGWCPPIIPIGPWKSIQLQEKTGAQLTSAVINNLLDTDYRFNASFKLLLPESNPDSIQAKLIVGNYEFSLKLHRIDDLTVACDGTGILSLADCWWPHTHGKPLLLRCRLVIAQNNNEISFDLGERGFKQLTLNRDNNFVELIINQQSIFCRGACWTNADVETLVGTTESLERSLGLARDAGMNMLRIGGTMVYESNEFYQLCDKLGIMVWQDFMFSNMDYPIHDSEFAYNIQCEVKAQLDRLAQFSCVSVYCGGNEVQQQSAMMGQSREHWSNEFFDTQLKHWCEKHHAGIPYFPSSPCEGALPFSVSEGISHYYGVGAYKRPLNDAILAQVKFASECLGFSNVPEPAVIDAVLQGSLFMAHHPMWKKGVARDPSAGWDFEDIRDFYLTQLFKQDAIHLRSHDPQRYLELSRVVSGEIMLRTIANLRTASHPCQGALIWFYKDLLPGAGWGLIDSSNQPKAAYYAVKRANKSLAIFFIDKGLDGLFLSLINETSATQPIKITLKAFKLGQIETVSISKTIQLESTALEISVNEWLGYFADLNYSFGFGPKQQDIIYVCIENADSGEWLHDDYYFVDSYHMAMQTTANITVGAIKTEKNLIELTITSDSFLQFVRLDIAQAELDDNYFHLAPNTPRKVIVKPTQPISSKVKGYVEAINLVNSYKFSQ